MDNMSHAMQRVSLKTGGLAKVYGGAFTRSVVRLHEIPGFAAFGFFSCT